MKRGAAPIETLIVGGGLSGLAVAHGLEQAGRDYLLIEARHRLGGRIETVAHGEGRFDLGPAWFWPGQPRIAALIAALGLEAFDQYASGALSFEDARGQVQRGRGFSSMEGSWRLVGGLGTLVDGLVQRLSSARIETGRMLDALAREGDGIVAKLTDGQSYVAERVVLALPPRLAAEVQFTPALPDTTLSFLRSVPTWMAGQAKGVALYDTPFWREAGLSGDAMSHVGPLVEIHDASPRSGGPYALFGFIGVPPAMRLDQSGLRTAIKDQLGRIFGPEASRPLALHLRDWAQEPRTATQADHAPLTAHPTYALPPELHDIFGGRLMFAGTEVAPQFGGYLEGALEAAENVVAAVLKTL